MQIPGEWRRFDDGVTRPAIVARILRDDLEPLDTLLLIDTGADRTTFSAHLLPGLRHFTYDPPPDISLSGIGGKSDFRLLRTGLLFSRDDRVPITVRGEFAVFLDPHLGDLSDLGRDVLDNFTVIVDRPAERILLLSPRHRCQVETY